MRQVYFSHSYRDRSVNSYFLDRFVQSDLSLIADQKSSTWCVAKLERYLLESSGFVSIIPRRQSNKKIAYSPYIGHEIALARRASVPRLLFVDEAVLKAFPENFPNDAVPFLYEEPGAYANLHDRAIKIFRKKLHDPRFTPLSQRRRKKATLIATNNNELLRAADNVGTLLAGVGYSVSRYTGKQLHSALHDVRLLETLRDSDICVFVLGDRLSYANVVQGMAYAHCIPSVLLRFDRRSADTNPDVYGLIRWSKESELMNIFGEQLDDFNYGMQKAVTMAKSTSSDDAILDISTSRRVGAVDVWDPNDGDGLVRHLSINQPYVKDRVTRVFNEMDKISLGIDPSREKSMEICSRLYSNLQMREDFVYELEPQSMLAGSQQIRKAQEFPVNNSATCIDLACLFASLLEKAYQRSVILVLSGPDFAHALVGYWAPDEPNDHQELSLGTLRGALTTGDLVLFEPTGVAHSEKPVGGESAEDRIVTNNFKLDFSTAKIAANNLLLDSKINLRFLADINLLRKSVS